jgi:hypothetical protein
VIRARVDFMTFLVHSVVEPRQPIAARASERRRLAIDARVPARLSMPCA